MKKEITHQDKLRFYEKFHSEDFIKLYQSLEQRPVGYGFMLTRAISMAAFIAGFFIPWFFMIWLATDLPILVKDIKRHKAKKLAIESLVEGITYSDFIEMTENGEWAKLGIESSAINAPSVHYVEQADLPLITEIEPRDKKEVENEPSAKFIKNIGEFVKIHGGQLIEYYTYNGYTETKETYITVRTHNGKILEFVVTPNDFVCIFEELNYSEQWKDFLYVKNSANNADL